MVVLTFCIDKQMQEKKYFKEKFLLFNCHLTAGISFGGKLLFLLDHEAIRVKNITSN